MSLQLDVQTKLRPLWINVEGRHIDVPLRQPGKHVRDLRPVSIERQLASILRGLPVNQLRTIVLKIQGGKALPYLHGTLLCLRWIAHGRCPER